MVTLLQTLRTLRDRVVAAGTARLCGAASSLQTHEAEYLLRTLLTSYTVALGQGQGEPFAQSMAELAEREACLGHPRRAEAVVFGFDLIHDLLDEIGPGAEFGPADAGDRRARAILDAGRGAFFGTWFRAKAEEDDRRDQALAAFADAAAEVPTIVYSTDAEGRLTDISHQAAELLGYRKEDLLGQHYSVLMQSEDADRFGHFIAERRTAGRATRRSRVALVAADGGVRTFELSSTGVYGRDGEFLGSDGVARAAEGQLLSLEYQLDAAGRILEISEAAASTLGYRADHLRGQHFSVLMEETERARVGRLFGERRRDRRAANGIRVVLSGVDGRRREFEISAVGRYDGHGEFAGTVGLGTDVSERGVWEEQVADARRRSLAAFDATDLGLMVVEPGYVIAEASAHHEAAARRPLAGAICHRAIFGSADPCPWCRLDEILSGAVVTSVETIESPLDGREYQLRFGPLLSDRGQVVAVVEAMVDVTDEQRRVKAYAAREQRRAVRRVVARLGQQPAPEPGPADLNEVVRKLLASVDLRGGITVEEDLCPSLPSADLSETDLSAVVAALLNNAVEAMPDGGALTVETALGPNGGVLLRISDTGGGLEPEAALLAFEPGQSNKPGHEGWGLTRADLLVHGRGGRLSLSGEPGAGTVAEVWLPACTAPAGAQP